MVKKIAGWVCVVGSVGCVVAFIIMATTGQISQISTWLRIFFIPPIVFLYGLRLLRSHPHMQRG